MSCFFFARHSIGWSVNPPFSPSLSGTEFLRRKKKLSRCRATNWLSRCWCFFLSFFFRCGKFASEAQRVFHMTRRAFHCQSKAVALAHISYVERSRDSLYGTKACKNKNSRKKLLSRLNETSPHCLLFFDQSILMLDLKRDLLYLCDMYDKNHTRRSHKLFIQSIRLSFTFKLHLQTTLFIKFSQI